MGLKDCQIILDNAWNTYYAGQTVNGRVEFTFDKPKKVRGMLKFYCSGWKEIKKQCRISFPYLMKII